MKAIAGISSYHPFFPKKHYPLIDIDADLLEWRYAGHMKIPTKQDIIEWIDKRTPPELGDGKFQITIEETEHGWHLYIWRALTIGKCEKVLNACPYIDKTYSRLGKERGFWFLRTVQMFEPPVPVTFMAIRGGNWYNRKCSN
jgi:hypothetical protein